MRYLATYKCRMRSYTVEFKKYFQFKEDAEEDLAATVEGIAHHFGTENIEVLKRPRVRKVD